MAGPGPSCSPFVLVDQAAEDLSPPYFRGRQVSGGGHGAVVVVWWPQVPGSVRAMVVVVRGVFIQDRAQVPWPGDQHPVGDLGPGFSDPALGIRVRSRAARRDLHYLDPRAREHRVEPGASALAPETAGPACCSQPMNSGSCPAPACQVRPREQAPCGNGPRSCPQPPTASPRPGCPAASPASSSPPAPQRAAASWAASVPAGHPSSAASRSSRCSATPYAPLRPAAPAGQRPPPPAPRSAPPAPGSAHHEDPRRPLRRRIGHSPQSSRSQREPPRHYRTRRQDVTIDHTPQHQVQRPECYR